MLDVAACLNAEEKDAVVLTESGNWSARAHSIATEVVEVNAQWRVRVSECGWVQADVA